MQGFKDCKKTGVIYVSEVAAKRGFRYDNSDWFNLGQGAAEAGEIQAAPARVKNFSISTNGQGYAPVGGIPELRTNISKMYNDLFRKGKKSKYSLSNINVSGGGRVVISRIIAAMGQIRVGYFSPDYTSYEGVLSGFNNVKPVAMVLEEKDNFKIDIEKVKTWVRYKKIKAILLSNPANPTGNIICGEELRELVDFAREEKVYLIIDEFYFNFLYECKEKLVSTAKYIQDVENDPVIIVCGLSKAWRYSGWRICWSVGPSEIMDKIVSTGSYLDGGASNPLQLATLPLVTSNNILKESLAIQELFIEKRDYMVRRLDAMGVKIMKPPASTFYVWGSLENLSESINDGMKFFEEAVKENVIVVPGKFFDINPYGKRKKGNFNNYVRFSFGPEMAILQEGLDRLEKVIKNISNK